MSRSEIPPAMRYALFSDVHANAEALSAVLEALRSERCDKLVCLGDTVGYGGSPNECCNIVREITTGTVLGNHDAAVAFACVLTRRSPSTPR